MLLVFHGEPSEYAAEQGDGTTPATARARARCSGRSACWPWARPAPVAAEPAGATHTFATSSIRRCSVGVEPSGGQELGTSVAGGRTRARRLRAAYALWGRRTDRQAHRRVDGAARAVPAGQVRLRPLYDWAFDRPAAALAHAAVSAAGRQRGDRQHDVVGGAGSWAAGCSRPPSPASCASMRWRSRSASSCLAAWLITGVRMSGIWTSTLLWLLPLGGAVLVLILPLRPAPGRSRCSPRSPPPCSRSPRPLDFTPAAGTQFEQSHSWIPDLGI